MNSPIHQAIRAVAAALVIVFCSGASAQVKFEHLPQFVELRAPDKGESQYLKLKSIERLERTAESVVIHTASARIEIRLLANVTKGATIGTPTLVTAILKELVDAVETGRRNASALEKDYKEAAAEAEKMGDGELAFLAWEARIAAYIMFRQEISCRDISVSPVK